MNNYETMSTEQIYDYINTLLRQRMFYNMTEKSHIVETIDIHIENCQQILDDRMELEYYKNMTKEDGVVVDTAVIETEDKKNVPKRKRLYKRPI